MFEGARTNGEEMAAVIGVFVIDGTEGMEDVGADVVVVVVVEA